MSRDINMHSRGQTVSRKEFLIDSGSEVDLRVRNSLLTEENVRLTDLIDEKEKVFLIYSNFAWRPNYFDCFHRNSSGY